VFAAFKHWIVVPRAVESEWAKITHPHHHGARLSARSVV